MWCFGLSDTTWRRYEYEQANNIALQRYSASAIEIDGVRDNGKLCSWDKDGNALDDDLSDLVLGSVHTSVRTV